MPARKLRGPASHLAESPKATPYIRGFSSFVASATALIALPGGANQFPLGTFTHCGPAPLRRTTYHLL